MLALKSTLLVILALLATFVHAKIFFEEKFDDAEAWEQKWVQSKHPGKEYGAFKRSAGRYYLDAEEGQGIQTSQDARFYGLSRSFEGFSNKAKNLVIQFSVKHEQDLDCGGGYVKLFDSKLEQTDLHGDSPYEIMFGPDICGSATKKVHVIFSYKGKNLELKSKHAQCKDDTYTHFYTLIVTPDNKYEVRIDNSSVLTGSLEEDFDFLPPKLIDDPNEQKPEDWDDRKKIPDPNDTKPEDWEQPKTIPDTNAKKPEDWDDDTDGEWEPPQIDNPEYKGEWTPKQIDNPNYKGEWVHPQIANPEYVADAHLYLRKDIGAIGFDLWQVKSGSIFDNILITDDIEEAGKQAAKAAAIIAAEEQQEKADKEAQQKKEPTEEEQDEDEDDNETEKRTDDDDDVADVQKKPEAEEAEGEEEEHDEL